ncbi:MAG: class I SAM-dependent methyltransferase [Solirubrobacteraceae bacterium]
MDIADFKARQRKMWASGDFPDIARTIRSAGEELFAAVGVRSGDRLLDVATGSGNVAIPAAQAGAEVVGLDITPELFEAARRRAEEANVDVEWVEGDAEALPFEDDSFDRVTSAFGAMFAPRHEVAAAELARVCRPGGVLAVSAWTPEGLNGQMFLTVGKHIPPPPDLVPPVLWGVEDHVRSLFPGIELELERRTVAVEAESTDAWVAYTERVLGPTVMAKAALEPEGRWEALRADLVELYERHNQASDGSLRAEAEYLLTVGRMPA